MERRLFLAAALSLLVLLAWQYAFPPPKPPAHPLQAPETSATDTSVPPPEETPGAPAPMAETIAAEQAEEVKLGNDLFEAVLTNRGGRVSSWRLKAYFTSDGKTVELAPDVAGRDDAMPLGLDLDDPALTRRVNEALFRVDREELAAQDGKARGERVSFTWADASGFRVVKSLAFRDGSYLVDLRLEVTEHGRPVPARLIWGPGFAARDGDAAGRFHYRGQAVINDAGRVSRLSREKLEGERKLRPSRLLWAGLEEQYFAALFLPEGSTGDVVIRQATSGAKSPPAAGKETGKKKEPELLVAISMPEAGAQLFVGPKKFTLLRGLGRQLEAVVWFSDYGLISWLAKLLLLALVWIHDRLVPNYGVAVILLTITVRLLLFPLNQHSMVSMKKMQTQMQRIQPKVNAIKAKYKKKDAESRTRLNQETMALYKKEGINPMGGMSGCLPMLAQFPILIAFYDVLIATVELRGAPFLGWIEDLTQKDRFYVTPLLMGATMFVQQWMTSAKATDPAQQQQQRMMLMMPVVFTVMFLNLPSGLVLYWFVNNLLGIGQQWLVNRHIGRLEAAAQKA